jgi:hypothetical protein
MHPDNTDGAILFLPTYYMHISSSWSLLPKWPGVGVSEVELDSGRTCRRLCRVILVLPPLSYRRGVSSRSKSQVATRNQHRLVFHLPRKRGAGRHLHHGPSQLACGGQCRIDASALT